VIFIVALEVIRVIWHQKYRRSEVWR